MGFGLAVAIDQKIKTRSLLWYSDYLKFEISVVYTITSADKLDEASRLLREESTPGPMYARSPSG